MPDLPRAEDTDDLLVRRELPGEPCRLAAAHAGTQVGEEDAEEVGGWRAPAANAEFTDKAEWCRVGAAASEAM